MNLMTIADASAAGLYDRLHVESWAPEYGPSLEASDDDAGPASPVDPTVEAEDWKPVAGEASGAPRRVVFVDGVRRIEARLTLDHSVEGPVPGILGAFGVGAVIWDRDARRSSFTGLAVERLAVMAKGLTVDIDRIGGLAVTPESTPGGGPSDLSAHLQQRMRSAEGRLAASFAGPDCLVVADGPFRELRAQPVVGYIKTHQTSYLDEERGALIGRLGAGRRTPLFLIDTERHPRYSWYLRLADLPGGHSWTGVVRCEAAASLGVGKAAEMAGWTAALLPRLASEGHIDRRAPQNLVPIAALERELRKHMGDQNLADRALRAAVHRLRSAGTGEGG